MTNQRHDPIQAATGTLERFMRAMFTQLITALARSTRTEDLSVNETAALHQIDRLQELRIGDLAEILALPLPTASRVATSLVKKGLIERHENPEDRRVRTLTVAPAGHDLLDRTSRERVNAAVALASSLPGNIFKQVGDAMQTLLNRSLLPTKGDKK